MIGRLRRWFAPPVFPDEARTEQARVMNSLGNYFLLTLAAAGLLYVPFFTTRIVINYAVLSIGGTVYVVSRAFIVRGKLVAAATVMIVTSVVALVVLIAASGGVGSPFMFALAAAAIAAGLLLPRRLGIALLALGLLAGLALALAQEAGVPLPQYFAWRPVSTWFIIALSFLFMNRVMHVATRSLQGSEQRYRALLEQASDMIFVINIDDPDRAGIIDANERACALHGYTRAEITSLRLSDIDVSGHDQATHDRLAALSSGKPVFFETIHRRKDGTTFPVEISAAPVDLPGRPRVIFGIGRDISDRRAAEERQRSLESRLVQAQKMESVGRLAGGVAHDFNNLLQVIMGRAEIALDMVAPEVPLYGEITQIKEAADRSSELTRQLLAFARRQDVRPRVIDLDDLVSAMLKMLQRMIGENIQLVWKPSPSLWPVRIDPSQVDQVLANLAVNARDAINGIGTLTVTTENVVLDEEWCRARVDAAPGEHVLLSVSDTGAGMSREVLEHVFEPFFTTKGVGHGTGLGLATVYGIVRQNNGFIDVVSAPGHGTSFRIYLPRSPEAATGLHGGDEVGMARGTETILVVEDEEGVLTLTRIVLEQLGYTVLAASSARTALALLDAHAGPVHLLLTDIVMPEMNGRDLRDRVAAARPGIRTLFMSGYTADVIAQSGVIDPGVNFLQKPFPMHDLAARIRTVLDGV